MRSRKCWLRWASISAWKSRTGRPRTSRSWPSGSTSPIEDPMRHRLRGRSFSRKSAHRKAMFENLAAALLKHEQIRTTLPKAKDLRPIVERLITLGKHGGLANRRRAIAALQDTGLANKVMTTLAERYTNRPGGYTRIIKAGYRYGDNARTALPELVARPPAAKRTNPPPSASKEETGADAASPRAN